METLKAHEAAILSINDVCTKLKGDVESGLSVEEANHRRRAVGFNEFQISSEEPLWKKYIEQFQNPLIILLLISAVISVFMKQFDDAVSITLAILIVVTVAFVQEYRSEKSLEALTQLVPPTCHCLRNGVVQEILARELVPGDLVCVNLGDRVPADIRITEAVELHIDESSFTGETVPAVKTSQMGLTNSVSSVSDLTNIAFMGTYVVHGHGKGVVICVAENSEFGSIFKAMQKVESPKTPLQKNMDLLGKQLSFYSLCIIVVIMVVGWLQGIPILNMFNIGVSLGVAAIPEGLPIVVTVTLALGVMRMVSQNAIVKKLPTVETLGCVNVVCSDKTGTVTLNELTALEIFTTSGLKATINDGKIMCNGIPFTPLKSPEISNIIEVSCICNKAHVRDSGIYGHPVEVALLSMAMKSGLLYIRDQYLLEEEKPFSSERKWMAVLVRDTTAPTSRSVWMVKGALDRLLPFCSGLDTYSRQALERAAADMGNRGLRVIATARGYDLSQLTMYGLVGMMDPPRESVLNAIDYLQHTNVAVKLLTGDSKETAISIAQHLGVWNGHCVSGEELEGDYSDHLKDEICQASVYYRVAPRHKITLVQALQSKGNIVAMTGDGTNDAIALKGADIGVAMGKSGTDVCREAADMILTDDNFHTIVAAMKEGKGIFYNIRNFVRFQLSTSIAALTLISVSTFLGLPNPLNAMQILWINIIMDGPPAQSLGVEPVNQSIVMQPPRKTTESVITKPLLLQTLQSAIIIVVGTLWIFYKEMSYDNMVTPRDTTMTFTCFVLFDMFNAYTCRSQMESCFRLGVFKNKAFTYAVVFSLVGQMLVVYFPPLQAIFLTEALTLQDIALLVCLASTVLWCDELRKLIMSGRLAEFFQQPKLNSMTNDQELVA